MSKHIDPMHVTEEDALYISFRPMLQREFVLQGYGDPCAKNEDGDLTYQYLVNEEGDYVNPQSDDSEAPSPASDSELGESNNIQESLPEDQRWTDDNKSSELKAAIEARNADREEDWKIVPVGHGEDGNVLKVDLQDALRADDQRISEYRAANPDE